MKGHQPGRVSVETRGVGVKITTHCACGWSATWDADEPRPASAWHAAHIADLLEQRARELDRQHAFYERTEHCGACGQPGGYCICVTPCGCHELHPVGAGLELDALDRFADSGIEQPGLFG